MQGVRPTSIQLPSKVKFRVQSSDVISEGSRINVLDENTKKVVWYRERFLSENEVIEHLIHSQTRTIVWSIHKPLKGWYIRIRAPAFPKGMSIPLLPVPKNEMALYGEPIDGALKFRSRTYDSNNTDNKENEGPGASSSGHGDVPCSPITNDSASSIHSYPPTPPAQVVVSPPSPTSVAHELERVQSSSSSKRTLRPKLQSRTTGQITEFILAPQTPVVPQATTTASTAFGLLARALQVIREHTPASSNSFVLSRVCSTGQPQSNGQIQSPPPTYTSSPSSPIISPPATTPDSLLPTVAPGANAKELPTHRLLPPFLTYTDQTPVYTVNVVSGVIEIDERELKRMGVDVSFWVCMTLVYLGFMEERESYLAAITD